MKLEQTIPDNIEIVKEQELIPMTEFIGKILDYAHESHNYERCIDIVKWYHELINTRLSIKMFTSDNPLFKDFEIVKWSSESINFRFKKSVFKFGMSEFGICLYTKNTHSKEENKMCYLTSFHLKTVEDLCKMGLQINMKSKYAETDLF
jgi:hypothetical protein